MALSPDWVNARKLTPCAQAIAALNAMGALADEHGIIRRNGRLIELRFNAEGRATTVRVDGAQVPLNVALKLAGRSP